MDLDTLVTISPFVIVPVAIWSVVWKGLALWRAARLQQKGWFIALLVINTLGILEILYIYIITRKTPSNSTNNITPRNV
jgi:methionyl-tRNA synthetase